MNRKLFLGPIALTGALTLALLPHPAALASTYGSGLYGNCAYQSSCSVSISAGGAVDLSLIPGPSPVCTVQSDTVNVSTNSATGYSLSLQDGDASSALTSGGNALPTASGSSQAPAPLAANTWGYRVDGTAAFGAGPTTSSRNAPSDGTLFAAIPTNAQTEATLSMTHAANAQALTTTVWYGLCATTSQPSGTYSDTLNYTALVN